MKDTDRIQLWNERYSRREEVHDFHPSPPLSKALEQLQPGRALDLACGAGRHALYLAERNWKVVAIDGSRVGLDILRQEAKQRGIEGNIETREVDLESGSKRFEIEPESYDLICDFYFLHRPLFEQIRRGLRVNGCFVGAIHVQNFEGSDDGSYLLKEGEPRSMIEAWGWKIAHYREGDSGETGHCHSTAEIIAFKR